MSGPLGDSTQCAVEDVLIVGGGIGGLSSAIALGQRGVRTTVVERNVEATGAAITFQYRPLYALKELGLIDRVTAEGAPRYAQESERAMSVFDGNGNQRFMPVAKVSDDWDLPISISIYRPVLAEIMQETARHHGGEVLLGHSYRSIKQREEKVEVELTTGERRAFDLVIGADGVYSSTREQFFPELGEPVYTGSMSFRAMLPDAPEHWPSGMHVHNGTAVFTMVLRDGQLYLALPSHMERCHVEQAEARMIMHRVLDDFRSDPLMAEICDAITNDVHVIVAPFDWIYVPPPWHRGRLVLVGDAAHATAPTIGSAGGMALEDAVVLAEELCGTEDVEVALGAYSARRWQRAKLVVEVSVEVMRGEQEHRPAEQWAAIRTSAFQKLVEPY